MTVKITCDWCTRPIDPAEKFTAEELNRMGFEEGLNDRHVVLESRYSGNGYLNGSEVGRFHHPGCYYAALRLLRDHRAWAEAQDDGPRGARVPRWDGERLKAPADVVGKPTKSRPGNSTPTEKPAGADARTLLLEKVRIANQRRKAGTPLDGLGIPTRAVHGLERSDIYTLEELAERTEQEVRAADGVGATAMRQLTEELTSRGLSLREGPGIAAKVGARIRQLRLAADMSRTDFVHAFAGGGGWGTSEVLSRQWEKGTKLPDDSAAQRIADLFGVSVDYVMCREED